MRARRLERGWEEGETDSELRLWREEVGLEDGGRWRVNVKIEGEKVQERVEYARIELRVRREE